MKLIATIWLAVLLPAAVISQLNCHRCFGNSYCNDGNHVDFAGNVWNATCTDPTSRNYLDTEGDDPFMTEVEKVINRNIREQFGQADFHNVTVRQHQCLTATVYEGRDNHTLRTCITTNTVVGNQTTPSLCELIATVIAPANYNNGSFSCRTCTSHFCNNHTLGASEPSDPIDPSDPSDPSDPCNRSNIASVSLFVVMAVVLVQFQLKGW